MIKTEELSSTFQNKKSHSDTVTPDQLGLLTTVVFPSIQSEKFQLDPDSDKLFKSFPKKQTEDVKSSLWWANT